MAFANKKDHRQGVLAMVLPLTGQPGTSSVLTTVHPKLGGYSPSEFADYTAIFLRRSPDKKTLIRRAWEDPSQMLL